MPREPHPLDWPTGWKQTPSTERTSSRFKADGFVRIRNALLNGLRIMGASHVVITSDLPVKSNGMPYATGRAENPGIAVWFVRKGSEQVIACDCYKTVHENLRAIQLTVDAIRGIERWGASELIDRAFAGFAALPAGSEAPKTREWWEVLEINETLLESLRGDDLALIIKSRFRDLSRRTHPDAGGENERMVELNAAHELAQHYIASKSAT